MSHVTGLGFVVLGLLFVGLALAIVSLVLLFRRSARAPIIAIVAAVLYFPAVLAEQTGHFSRVHAPAAIETVELIQTAVALVVIGVGLFTLRRGNAATNA